MTLTLAMISFAATSQNIDTLWMGGARDSTLYYWDDNWIDHYLGKLTSISKGTGFGNKSIFARPCLVKDSMVIVGGAVAAEISNDLTGVADTLVESMVPEYLIFYDNHDSNPMHELARTRYDTCNHSRQRMELQYRDGYDNKNYYPMLRKAMLETPIVVRDSFYVGVTQNNHTEVYGSSGNPLDTYYDHRGYEIYTALPMMWPYDTSFYHHPPHYKEKAQVSMPPFDDTLWRTYSSAMWFVIFPIFDTTGYYHRPITDDDTLVAEGCDTVSGLRLMEQESTSVTLAWNTDNHSRWELSYGPEGTDPEQGERMEMAAPFACISDCDTGVAYRAYVRTVCGEDSRSPWGQGIPFEIHGDQVGVHASDLDDLTWLYPNPASSSLRVFSSYHIREVLLYANDGRPILRIPVDAYEALVDLGKLPQGLYLAVIRTAYGDTTRKLIVRR